MASDFVHLHVHTDYSLLDGACKIAQLAEQCKAFGMGAIAITDHGNMHGAIEFYKTMKGAGIKPIIGCEFYQAPGSCMVRNPNHKHRNGYHQLLIAQSYEGYQNLCRLNSASYLKGFYFKPRMDKELLQAHSKGLIGTTGCIGSEVCQAILEGDVPKAREALGTYMEIFGKDNYFIELQDHGMKEQREVNKVLLDFHKEFGLKLIATNDVHYLKQEHALPHELLLCIGTQKTMLEDHMKFPSNNFYLKTGDEMGGLFKEYPEALSNTLHVAEMVDCKLKFGENHYPVYEPPAGVERRAYLTQLCVIALRERYGFDLEAIGYENLTPEHRIVVDRMYFEIGVIDKMGFLSYFLVVWDFLHYARTVGIPVGPGRGSGAGSIVAYLLHITDIEPLRFNLLFERFLNPERVSPPDFDIDLCERRRVEVIDYVKLKYGADRVAQICTFGKLKAKAVLKDVARVLGRNFEEGNRITKMVPADPKMTIKKALEESSELKTLHDSEAWVQDVFIKAGPLEGLNRGLGIHAAGVIIGDQPLTDLIPLAKGAGDEVITQYDASPCEELGLLKMDFLGLRTLTIIQDTCDIIKKAHKIDLKASDIPLDDLKTYELLSRGETVCIFQLESGGMQDLCRRWQVTRIEDISALLALYRPGPMAYIDEFLDRKFGRKKIDYDVPQMIPVLEETYGIMLYQEQVMQVVQVVAGFSLGGADILRRAMGKKKADVMAQQFDLFVQGSAKHLGISKEVAKNIWDKIETFAGYGFNKSHSAAYAFLSCHTAYLKANYPVAFMAANMTSDMRSADRLAIDLRETREMGIKVLPPNVNVSQHEFTVDGPNIRFGLAAIKGVGQAAADAIIQAREADGEFATLQEFCERVSGVNRRLLESLTQCGALDCFGLRRSQTMSVLEATISRAQAAVRDREAGQSNFFDLLAPTPAKGGGKGGGAAAADSMGVPVPDIPEWDSREMLKHEKDLLGFYVTGHPLGEHEESMTQYGLCSILDIASIAPDTGVRLAGLITGLNRKISKRDGKPWAIVSLEDRDANIEVMVYSEVFEKCSDTMEVERAVFLEGFVQLRDGEEKAQLIASKVVPIEQAPVLYTKEVYLALGEDEATPTMLDTLRTILRDSPGSTPVILALHCTDGDIAMVELPRMYNISFTPSLKLTLRRLLGEEAVTSKADRTPPVRERPAWKKRDSHPVAS